MSMTHLSFSASDPPGIGSALLLMAIGVLSILIGIRKRPDEAQQTPLPQLSVFGGIVAIFLGFYLLIRLIRVN